MKYRKGDYLQIPRQIFRETKFINLSAGAKAMYFLLKEFEHQYSEKSCEGWFYKSDKDIGDLLNLSVGTVRKCKKELLDINIISARVSKPIDVTTGKKSEKGITEYKINDSFQGDQVQKTENNQTLKEDKGKVNKFQNFAQRKYDFNELEKAL